MAIQFRNPIRAWAAMLLAVSLLWVVQRLVAEDDIPRFVRQAGQGVERKTPATSPAPESLVMQRLREGATLSNVEGAFEAVGERMAFHPSSGQGPYVVLENLMLERVERVRGETGPRTWIVSGVLTEYNGHNYLLLQRAVVGAEPGKSAAPVQNAAGERS